MPHRCLTPSFEKAADNLRELARSLKSEAHSTKVVTEMADIERQYDQFDTIAQYKLLTDLIELKCVAALPLMHRILFSSPSALIRHEAAFGLGALGDQREAPALVNAMLNDGHTMVRHEAAIALATVGDESSLPALQKATEQETEPAVIESVLFAIQQILLNGSWR
jgi:HEAT repeat protein